MTEDEIDDLMREHNLPAIRNRDFRTARKQQMTQPEWEEYMRQLNFARAIQRAADPQSACTNSNEPGQIGEAAALSASARTTGGEDAHLDR